MQREEEAVRSTILVGLGGSGGWQALAWAIDEATATGAGLVLLHACPPDSPLAARAPSPSLAIIELFDPSLARAIASTRTRLGGDRVQLRLLPGRPGPLLATAAARADLVVVGPPARRHRGGYGSTTHHVLAHAPSPVMVVRPITAGYDAPLLGHVVAGDHGHGQLGPAGRALLGSVAHGAVDEATGPVAVVRAAAHAPAGAALGSPQREGATP
jgi:nucleotide-binding universal stress UspA family protein